MHYISVLDKITDFQQSVQALEALGLVVKEFGDLYIVKYDKSFSQMNNLDVIKSRGLVLEKNTNKIVCVPPPKSLDINYYHNKFLNNDSEGVVIEEFYDGTMINVFKHNNVINIATRSNIGANCKWNSSKTFNLLFNESMNIDDLNTIEEGYSFSFLLQHPENKIVKEYIQPNCILTMVSKINDDNTVKILNREETENLLKIYKLNLELPNVIETTSMEDLYKRIDSLNDREQGYILKYYCSDGFDNRSKIRNLRYNRIRSLKCNTNNKMFMFYELRKQNNIMEYLHYFPEDKELFDNFRMELYNFTSKLHTFYLNLKIFKKLKFLEIDFEFRPFINELHTLFTETGKVITKRVVIEFLHNLETPRLLFAINYKKKQAKTASA